MLREIKTMPKKIFTLCLLRKDDQILLGIKKYGFGVGKWNGFGGKVEKGESIVEATKREMREEAGVEVVDLEKFGLLDFEFQDNPDILEVHIFHAKDFSGMPNETSEMKPQWFEIDRIPYAEMWPDDQFWLPLFLAGKKFKGKFLFNQEKETKIIRHNLEIMESLE
jgi:8-oxo-dGTP diphosphatase / 2-hydroxy-dATP diphosphatase